MTFKAAPFSASRRGLISLAVLLLIEASLLWLLLSAPVSGYSFLLLLTTLALGGLILYLAWRAWACLSLSYWIDRNALTVAWGPLHHVIPLGSIEEITRGGEAASSPHWLDRWPRLEHWLLYGKELGRSIRVRPDTDGAAEVLSLASLPLAQQLVLRTDGGLIGISPSDPDRFLVALEQHHQLGPTRVLRQERRRPRLLEASLWQDVLGLSLLTAGLLGSLLLMGTLMLRYPALPAQIPGLEAVDRAALFLLPAFGFAVWAVNGLWGLLLYRGQRVAALLLWAGTLAAQFAALAALISLTN